MIGTFCIFTADKNNFMWCWLVLVVLMLMLLLTQLLTSIFLFLLWSSPQWSCQTISSNLPENIFFQKIISPLLLYSANFLTKFKLWNFSLLGHSFHKFLTHNRSTAKSRWNRQRRRRRRRLWKNLGTERIFSPSEVSAAAAFASANWNQEPYKNREGDLTLFFGDAQSGKSQLAHFLFATSRW